MKRTRIIFFAIILLLHASIAMAYEARLSQYEDLAFSRTAYIHLFENAGFEIPEDADFGVCKAKLSNGTEFNVAKMSVIDGASIKDNIIVEYQEDRMGKKMPVPLEITMAEQMIQRGTAALQNTQTKTKYNVTFTAEYDKRYNSSTQFYEYKPKKVSMVSSSTQDAKVNYYIYGWKSGANPATTGGHSIIVAKYPAYQGQLYSQTNPPDIFYQPYWRYHKLVVTVGNHNTVDIYLNGQYGYDDDYNY